MRETLRQPHGQPSDASGVTLSEARSNHCRAIPFWQSLLVFGAPGLLIWAGVHWLVPAWVGAGVPLVFAWSFCVLVPTIGNAVVVLTIYAVREHPDSVRLLLDRSICLRRTNLEEALRLADKAVELDQRNGAAHSARGNALFDLERHEGLRNRFPPFAANHRVKTRLRSRPLQQDAGTRPGRSPKRNR